MAKNNNPHPDWLKTFLKEAPIHQTIIVNGNVQDIFYDSQQKQDIALPKFLKRMLMSDTKLGFNMAGIWNQIYGLGFNDNKALKHFQNIAGNTSACTGTTHTYCVYDMSEQTAGPFIHHHLSAAPTYLFAAIRSVFDSPNERAIFFLDFIRCLGMQAATPDPGEKPWMLLGKAIADQEPASINSDDLMQNRGLIVLLTANLGRIPPFLYQADPRIKLITIP